MATETDICNAALVKIGEQRITVSGFTTPGNERERCCAENYARIRDAELRKNIWNFTVTRAELAADPEEPAYGYGYRYQLPSDCLRLIEVWEGEDFQVEGKYIVTDYSAPIHIRYVRKVTVINDFDPVFRDVISARLAIELCDRLTARADKRGSVQVEYSTLLSQAAQTDAIENPNAEPPVSDLISCRA